MNKKAILFTFMAILIAALLAMMFATTQIRPLDEDIEMSKASFESANQYIDSLKGYTKASLSTTGYRALQGMIEHIAETGQYYIDEQDIKDSFKECVMNATLKGGDCPFMTNFTINHSLTKIKELTEQELPFQMNYQIHEVKLDQFRPFTVTAYINITINVTAKDMKWNIQELLEDDISLTGLKDPLYFDYGIEYNGSIKQTKSFKYFFNASNFQYFVENNEYIESDTINVFFGDKPYSFFGRLANDSNVKEESIYSRNLRIISILDPDRTTMKNNQSYVSHLYNYEFTKVECTFNLKGVNGDNSGARVDKKHLTLTFRFNESELVGLTC